MVLQCLKEANNLFSQKQFEMGASRIDQAARAVHANPGAYPEFSAVQLVSSTVQSLERAAAEGKANGDTDNVRTATSAEEHLLRSLIMWEPRNVRWSQMQTACLKTLGVQPDHITNPERYNLENRSGDGLKNSIGGTNSRYTSSSPKTPQYSSKFRITPDSLKSGPWGPGLGRARINWSKMPARSAGSGGSGGAQGTNCANCGHYMAPGVSWCTSCGR